MAFGREKLTLLSASELDGMRAAGRVLAEVLEEVSQHVAVGVSTQELDAIAAEGIAQRGARAAFLGYHGFPASLCISVNDEVVHGIPSARTLEPADVVSIDGGVVLDGWYADSAVTVLVPGGDEALMSTREALVDNTREALWSAIAAFQVGAHLNDLGAAADDATDPQYGIIEDYTGHGIGRQLHLDPEVVAYRVRQRGPKLKPGLCLAIEPMLVLGDPETSTDPDGWTVRTIDGSMAAHWEHTVALTENGPEVLTLRPSEQAPPSFKKSAR